MDLLRPKEHFKSEPMSNWLEAGRKSRREEARRNYIDQVGFTDGSIIRERKTGRLYKIISFYPDSFIEVQSCDEGGNLKRWKKRRINPVDFEKA